MSGIEERLVSVSRVVKVVKGGRRFRFAALVVVGDKKGRVGIGTGKANEVPNAIKKASSYAKRNMINIYIGKNDSIPFEWNSKYNSTKLLLKPAPDGKGIIASDVVRAVLELAGYRNMYSKILTKSKNPTNIVRATIKALTDITNYQNTYLLRNGKQPIISNKRSLNRSTRTIENASSINDKNSQKKQVSV